MDKRSRIADILRRFRQDPNAGYGEAAPEEPAYLFGTQRSLTECDAPDWALPPTATLEEARQAIADALSLYLADPAPQAALLVKALPGVGKTTAAVAAVEEQALSGRRALYFGPRHEFYGDVLGVSRHPDLWHEWLPRQSEEGHQGIETCQYAEYVATWLHKGYKAMDFCSSVCGWGYVNGDCPYHAQKRCGKPCIFGQHQHLTMGHPLTSTCHLAVVDEYPMSAFLHEWTIPTSYMLPPGMDPTKALTQLLAYAKALSTEGQTMHGPALLTVMGGPALVLEAVDDFYDMSGDLLPPSLYKAEDVSTVGYNFLPDLAYLLRREAKLANAQQPYIPRLEVTGAGLTMLLRARVNEEVPATLACLDATANEHLYKTLLGRPVEVLDAQPAMQGRVFQFYERANGKGTLETDGELSAKVPQTEALVEHIVKAEGYQAPAIITFKGLVEKSTVFRAMGHSHYYAARGTNAHEQADALFVVGAPQPPLAAMERQARMIFFERDRPFSTTWSTIAQPYRYLDENGKGRQYPISGYWGDQDLNALLWSMREAEIIQAAHRARPALREVDIWLLENLPIMELPPDELLAYRDTIGSPVGVNPFTWERVVRVMEEIDERQGYVTMKDIRDGAGVSGPTAAKYWAHLLASGEWRLLEPAITKGQPGRPRKRLNKAE